MTKEIPRVRITSPIRSSDNDFFSIQRFQLSIGQGHSQTLQRVDLSLSKDGGISFSANLSKILNPLAHRQNRLNWWQLGRANDLTLQLRFWGHDRFVVGSGFLSITPWRFLTYRMKNLLMNKVNGHPLGVYGCNKLQACYTHLSDEGFQLPLKSTSIITQLNQSNKTGTLIYDASTQQFKGNVNGHFKIFQLD